VSHLQGSHTEGACLGFVETLEIIALDKGAAMCKWRWMPLLVSLASPLVSAVAQKPEDGKKMEHGEMEMMMQPGADRMHVAIKSPAEGSKTTTDKLPVQVATAGFQDRCDLAGKPNQEGTGHYHLLLDKSLVNMYCSDRATVSLEGVKPGRHTLTAVPAQNDHSEVEKNASSITIDYAPSQPKPLPKATAAAGAPSIKIVSPKPGTTVSGSFDVVVDVKNFSLTCAEMGKPDVPGHGHWHLNFDTMKGPMMGMMTMAAMSCEQRLVLSTAGLKPGSTHKLIALLADNVHAPVMPEVADSVAVTVR